MYRSFYFLYLGFSAVIAYVTADFLNQSFSVNTAGFKCLHFISSDIYKSCKSHTADRAIDRLQLRLGHSHQAAVFTGNIGVFRHHSLVVKSLCNGCTHKVEDGKNLHIILVLIAFFLRRRLYSALRLSLSGL